MARCAIRNPLLLPELFHHILDYIDEAGPTEIKPGGRIHMCYATREARKDLLALAQTCYAISGPSLDRLWRTLNSLVPLIRCFARVADEDRAKTPPSPGEWAIIRRYGVRVRELWIYGSVSDISLHFLRCTASQSLRLLPNLRVLIWDGGFASCLGLTALIEQLLVPGLVSLDISLVKADDLPLRLVECYAGLCPSLKTLRWQLHRGVSSHGPACRALSGSLVGLKQVENLGLSTPLDPISLKHVILSPQYKILSLVIDQPGMQQMQFITTIDTPFPNVEVIALEICDLDVLTRLLRPCRQAFNLLTVELQMNKPQPSAYSIHSCLTALATPQRIHSVLSIAFSHFLDFSFDDLEFQALEDAPMTYCITYETLSPLASFHCLYLIQLRLTNQISLDDHELTALARNWPSLEVLALNCRSGGWPCASAKYVSLRGLLALVVACPKLSYVCLPIDARVVPMDASPNMRNDTIEEVVFPFSPISEPRSVVKFLIKHLPGVAIMAPDNNPFVGQDAEYMARCAGMWGEALELLLDHRRHARRTYNVGIS